tara:strand:- start:281 stop:520 length:240 start_codon:yes stop_codon:yes gene_type:complete
MIPNDKNFSKEFSSVIKDLDGVLEKNKSSNSATVSLAFTSILTRFLIKTAPNDFVIIQTLFAPYLETRNQQIKNEIKKG